jgi:hypothetical protein
VSNEGERNTPIVRVDLKRADAAELVKSDQTLENCALVRALGPSWAQALAKGVVRRYLDKVVVFQQNDAGSSLFLVLAGEAKVVSRKQSDAVELGVAHKGDVLGEAEMLSARSVRSTTVVACSQLDLVELSREALSGGPGLPLPVPVFRALREVSTNRTAKLNEMADFLNRW